MSSSAYRKVAADPRYQELKSKRARFAWTLAAIVLGTYYGFMMIVTFAPDLVRVPLAPGWALTIGFPIGAAIIICAWLLTGVYIRRANGEFEALTQQILKEAAK